MEIGLVSDVLTSESTSEFIASYEICFCTQIDVSMTWPRFRSWPSNPHRCSFDLSSGMKQNKDPCSLLIVTHRVSGPLT